MNKRLILMLIASLTFIQLKGVSIEADASAYFLLNHTTKKIYGPVWQYYGFAFDHMQPFLRTFECVSFFSQVGCIFSQGRSEGGNQPTKIRVIPLTLGFKWIQKVRNAVELYAGAAPGYYFMNLDNDSCYVPQHPNTSGWGGHFCIGSFLYPKSDLMINLFLNYSYITFKALTSNVYVQSFFTDVSGFGLGAGIGWNF